MTVKRANRFRRLLAWILVIAAFLGLLTLSLSPSTPPTIAPNAAQVLAAKTTFMRVKSVSGSKLPVYLTFNRDEMAASAALAGRAANINHVAVEQSADDLSVSASVPVVAGTWLNLRATATPTETGFPSISAKIGRIPIPAFIVRATANMARIILGWRGLEVPPLDVMVQSFALSEQGATTKLMLPKGTKLFRAINQAQSRPVDTATVAKIYCSLSSLQQRVPATDFATHVRRAFTIPAGSVSEVERNRAAFVALAMFTASPGVGSIAGDTVYRVRACPAPPGAILLLQRADLAKHWAISAALAATFGADVSQAMGTWKEVADSGPQGSGFSFIDLSADRSGMAFAERASSENTASSTRVRLQTIDEDTLLPLAALALAEGLTEEQFVKRYTNVESTAYDAMVLRIDTILAQQNLQ